MSNDNEIKSEDKLSKSSEVTEIEDLTLKNDLDFYNALEDSKEKEIKYVPFDPLKAREERRGKMAFCLLLFLFVEVGFLFYLFANHTPIADLKDLSIMLLSPIVTLTGTVFGFYFGSKE